MMKGERSDWVDYAKALGILLVVYGHVARGLVSSGLWENNATYRLVDSVIYSFHMPLFFFLSGIFFLNSLGHRSFTGFIANKIDTVAYPYVLWSLIQGFVEVNLSKHKNAPVTYDQIASLFKTPRAQFWFLHALFIILIISAALYQRKKKSDSLLILAIASALYLQPFQALYSPILSSIANNWVFFTLGVFIGKYIDTGILKQPTCAFGLLLCALLFEYIFHGKLNLNYQDKGLLSLIVAVASILAVAAVATRAPRSYPLLLWIGRNSMAIYLMHILAASGTRIVLSKGFGIDTPWLQLALGLLTGVFFPLWLISVLGKRGEMLLSAPPSLSAQRLYDGVQEKKMQLPK